jgi:hypothetical protein
MLIADFRLQGRRWSMASNAALAALHDNTVESREGSLVGMLETWSLVDIMTWLHQSQRTAMVRIGIGLGAGVLFFKYGHLYRVEWGPLGGEQALIALLQLEQGSFSLIQRDPPAALPNIQRPTAELLLHLAVARDERQRQGCA